MQFPLIKPTRYSFPVSFLQAGLLAGTLDLIGATLVYVVILKKASLMVLLQGIASGIFGTQAFQGGWAMALLGVVFHYGIAFIFTTIYLLQLAYRPEDRLAVARNALVYGVIIWAVMNLLVVPLSAVPHRTLSVTGSIVGALILVLLFALPLAWFVKRHFKPV